MRIAGKHVKNIKDGVDAPEDGQLLIFDATADVWVPIDAGDLPVSAAGVSATTLNAALAELAAADA